jgi:hypothetical protein
MQQQHLKVLLLNCYLSLIHCSMFISSMLCPTCKKGEIEEKSIVTGILDSNSDIRTELICNVCQQRLV